MEPALLSRIWQQANLLLNATLVARGIEHMGDDSRLACVRNALASGQRVSISAVGGSITAGSSYAAGVGSSADFLYHRKVAIALDSRFPVLSSHGRHNGGVPGTGPTYMEHCVHDHLPPDVNLVLLEYAVNTDRQPAAFERLLRKLILHPRQPGLIVVNAHRWRAIRPHDGRTDKCWRKNWPVDMARNRTQWLAQAMGSVHGAMDKLAADEDEIAALCAHYNVPLVSMRAALVEAVREGKVAIPDFMNDCKHPSGVGHTFLAQLILQRLLRPPPSPIEAVSTPAGAAGRACSGAATVPVLPQLPEPYFGLRGQEMASSVCARGEQLRQYLDPSGTDGFNMTDEGRGKGKLGYLAYGVGRAVSFCLPWPARAERTKPPQVLWVGFLRSYEHMGRARVSCTGACACASDVIDGHDIKDGVSVTDVRRVVLRPARRTEASDDRCCRIRLQITRGTSSGEHKFKVMSLLLGGADAHNLQVFSLRVAASASEADPSTSPRTPRGRRRARKASGRMAR